MIPKKKVLEQLKEVIDPELDINIVDLGLIYSINIDQEKKSVDVKMTLTSPGCPLSFVFEDWIKEKIGKIRGVKNVTINLVWEPAWDPDKMTDEAREKLEFDI